MTRLAALVLAAVFCCAGSYPQAGEGQPHWGNAWVLLMIGQSNCGAEGDNLNPNVVDRGSFVAWGRSRKSGQTWLSPLFDDDDVTEETNTNEAGTPYPRLAERIHAQTGKHLVVLASCTGSADVASWDSTHWAATKTFYGNVLPAGVPIHMVIWNQGEADTASCNGTTRCPVYAAAVESFLNTVDDDILTRQSLKPKMAVVSLGHRDAAVADDLVQIRLAQADVDTALDGTDGEANVCHLMDFLAVDNPNAGNGCDGTHYCTDAMLSDISDLYYDAFDNCGFF